MSTDMLIFSRREDVRGNYKSITCSAPAAKSLTTLKLRLRQLHWHHQQARV
jgi:hypothetical protein